MNAHGHASVLVVEDVPEVRKAIADCLRREGHVIHCASDGREGLRLMASVPLDLVITDILMPEKDGLEILAEARQKYPPPPVIAVSGGGYLADKRSCLKAAKALGAAATIEKPFTREELLGAVGRALTPEPAAS